MAAIQICRQGNKNVSYKIKKNLCTNDNIFQQQI